MPKVGMEPMRRAALIDSTIAEIGADGTLDVTVGQIARRAGISSALAHHYFGSKDQMFLAAMRHILREFAGSVSAQQRLATTPITQVTAIINASLSPTQFSDETIAAWLAFYVKAQNAPDVARLLRVYTRRLNSNLVYHLSQIVPDPAAREIARGIAAMIDGFYIRHALRSNIPQTDPTGVVLDYLNMAIAYERPA